MRTLLVLGCIAGLLGELQAADTKIDPTGTWIWETYQNGMKWPNTLKLQYDGKKITGMILGRQNTNLPIGDATFQDGELSFSISREVSGTKFVTKYRGKLEADTLKLSVETERGGRVQKQQIEARREKSSKTKDN